ncbi:MAG: riboflavin synthase [Acidimicrobiia bacterium]
MFTGIVEGKGTVVSIADSGAVRRVVITAPGFEGLTVGASVAVNGVCLTAVAVEGGEVTVDIVPETLSRTTLAELKIGDEVNLERPLRADGRFDGHVVQGHVDGVGWVQALGREGGAVSLTLDAPPELLPYIVEKGSVTVDGVSLTVSSLTDTGFSVALVPHTLEVTTLGLRKPGDPVNLEVDILAKYIERLLKAGQ